MYIDIHPTFLSERLFVNLKLRKCFPEIYLYIIFILIHLNWVAQCTEKTINTGRSDYELLHSTDELNDFTSFHHLQKRDLKFNSTYSTKNDSLHNSTISSTPTTSTSILSNTTSVSTNSLYDPDNAGLDDFDQEGYNTTNLKKEFDYHRYYRSYNKTGKEETILYWVDFDRIPEEKIVAHDSLSSAYRRALTVSLSFNFPFYGHVLRNITIATGGFLFTGSFLHKWLAATQYIAPLMANFDTSVSTHSTVKYADNGTSLTVEWEKVVLQDNPSAGTFTFQVTIHNSGRIVFAYKDIPVIVTLIEDLQHPVKVGLSDAYIVEKTIFYVRKKTIYEYHKIDLKKGFEISNWTAIVFEPLTLCVSQNSCQACLEARTKFECSWCANVGKCSDGLDRHRQIWLEGGCKETSISTLSSCALLPPPAQKSHGGSGMHSEAASLDSRTKTDGNGGRSSLLTGLIMMLVLVVIVGGWITYAYLNPHTPSGQILIKYRPSAWSWRRGEARYTAATMHSIHM